MARKQKKLQSLFERKLSSKYLKTETGIKQKYVEGIFGSSKFVDLISKCKEGVKSIDFAFIGDSNNAAANILQPNYTNAAYSPYGTNKLANDNTYLNAWGYLNGFANALLNNNFNLYGGPVEPAVTIQPQALNLVNTSYGGSGSGSGPQLGSSRGPGVSHYLISSGIPNANDTDYAINAGCISLPQFKIKPRTRSNPTSLNNLTENTYYKFHQKATTARDNKILGIFAKNYFTDSYINQFNSEKSPLDLNRQSFINENEAAGGLMPYFFAPEYELQGDLNSCYVIGSNNPLLNKPKLKYRTLVWESSESNGYFPMSMYYNDTVGGTINAYVLAAPTPDAMGSLADASGSDQRNGTRLCRFFKGKLVIDPTKANMNEQISFVIQGVSRDGTLNGTGGVNINPMLYSSGSINGFNLRNGAIRENGFCKIIDKGGNDFTLHPFGHLYTNPKEEGFYNQVNSAGAADPTTRVRNITTTDHTGNPQRVYLKLINAIAGTTVDAGTAISIAADSLVQADMLDGYPNLNTNPILLSSVSTNTGSIQVNGSPLSSANSIGIVAVDTVNKTVTFNKSLTIPSGVSEVVFTSNNEDRIPVISVFSKLTVWNPRIPPAGITEQSNEPYIMKDGSGNNITTRTIFNNVILEYFSNTNLGIHNFSTNPRTGRPQNTQIMSQLATKNNLIQHSKDLSNFASFGTVTDISSLSITNSIGTTYSNLTGKSFSNNLEGIRYIVPRTQLYSGVNEFYYDTVSNSTFSIWVNFTGTTAKLGISLERESDNVASTNGTALTDWTADPSVLGPTGVVAQSATCVFVEGPTGVSGSDFTVSQVGNDWSALSTTNARFLISPNSNGTGKWVRFSVHRSNWFTTIRVVNIGGGNAISVALPQLETFPSASTNILTEETAFKSIGRWAPREAEYSIKFEQEAFNALSSGAGQQPLVYPPSFLFFTHDFWGSKWRKGPYSIAAQSVYSDGYGFSISSLYSMSGGKVFDSDPNNTHDFYKAVLECTPQGSNQFNTTLRTIFKEYRSRQLSATSGNSGNVCIMIQGGLNDASAAVPARDFVDNIKKLTNLLYTEWNALGYPPQDFCVVFMISHNRGRNAEDARLASYSDLLTTELAIDKDFFEKLTFINTPRFVTSQELIDNVCYEYTADAFCDPHSSTIKNPSEIQENKMYRILTIDGAANFITIGSAVNSVGTTFKSNATNPGSLGNSTVVELYTGVLGTPNYNKATNTTQLLHLHKKGYNFIANRIISRILSAK